MSFNCLKQLVTSPTRYTDTTATCLDLILTPITDTIRNVGVLTPICSDHSVPFIELNTHIPRTTSYKQTFYNYSNLDIDKFRNCLRHSNLSNTARIGDLDSAAEKISDVLMSQAKKFMPVKTIKVCERDPPWVNAEIKKSAK